MAGDLLAETRMIFAKNCHHLFGLGGLGEGRKAAQIAENDGHLATMAFEKPVPISRRNDEVGDLRGQKPPQPAHPLDLRHLLRHRLFQGSVPCRQLRGLILEAPRLALDGVVKRLLAQHRSHARQQRPVLERLGQIVVAAGVQSLDDISRIGFRGDKDDRNRPQRNVLLEHAHDADAIELRHHDVEQDQIRLEARAPSPAPLRHPLRSPLRSRSPPGACAGFRDFPACRRRRECEADRARCSLLRTGIHGPLPAAGAD